MKLQQGTQRARKYWRNVYKHCPGGDCLCDVHEGVTDRLNSRAVQNRADDRIISEYDDCE